MKQMTKEEIIEMGKITEENVVDKRAEMDAMIQGMIEMGKEAYDPYIEQLDFEHKEVTTRDGTPIKIITYRPKTLAS